MNQHTTNGLTLARHYHLADALLAEPAGAKTAGHTVLVGFDPATGILSATVPATRKAWFWTVRDVEKELRDAWIDSNRTFGRHARAIVPGAAIAEVDFPELAVALFADMRDQLEGKPVVERGPLPDALKADLDAPERAAEQRARGKKLERIADEARGAYLHDLAEKCLKQTRLGYHAEEHENTITVTPERVKIDMLWRSPVYKGHTLAFNADSDTLAATLCTDWQERRSRLHSDPYAWPNKMREFKDLWCFEPTPAEFNAIAVRILQGVLTHADLKATP